MKIKKRNFLFFALSVFGLIFLAFFYRVPQTNAAILPGNLNTKGASAGASDGVGGQAWFAVGHGQCPLTGGCTDGFEGPYSKAWLYSTTQTMVVTIESAGGGCGSEDNNSDGSNTVFSFGRVGGYYTLPYANNGTRCGTTTITYNAPNVITTVNGVNYYTSSMLVQLGGATPYLENSFRLQITNNPGGSYIGMAKQDTDNNAVFEANFSGLYQKDNGGARWSTSIQFAPPCSGAPTVGNRLRWFDADFQKYGQNLNPVLSQRLERRPKDNSTGWVNVDSWTGLADIGNSGLSSDTARGFTFNRDFKYRWTWENVAAINTIQIQLPFDQIYSLEGRCPSPPTPVGGAGCTAFSTTPNINSGDTVIVGTPVNVSVYATNSGNKVWNNAYLVYVNEGPNPPAPGYVQKFSATPDAGVSPPVAGGILPPGANGPVVDRGNADTSTPTAPGVPRTYTYKTYHLKSIVAGVPNWEALGSCSFSINVIPQPYSPEGEINNVGCGGVTFTVRWSPPRAVNLSGYLRVSSVDGTINFDTNFNLPNGESQTVTFNDMPSLPIHLDSYRVALIVNDDGGNPVQVAGQIFTGNCVGISCPSTFGDYEFGDPNPFRLEYVVRNQTNRTDSRYDVALSNPPGGSINSPDLGANGNTTFTTSFSPTASTTVTGTLTYSGGSTGLLPASCPVVVVRYPYLKAYGADIGSGGGFDQTDTTTNTVNTCTPSTQTGIFAYMRPRTQHNNTATGRSGSGGQINAYAWGNALPPQNGDISGFATAERRATATSISNLAFGSIATTSIADNTNQADIGGNLTGEAPCMPDYFYQTQYPTDSPITEDYPFANLPQGQLISNNGKQLIRNGNLSTNPIPNFQGRVTLYIKGDLYIDRDITYKSYITVAEIPNLTFVVLGNIYINPGVTTLDGTYIAQPNPAQPNTGRIYTCATALGDKITSATAVYSTCSGGYGPGDAGVGKLTFNGSVVAQQIILNRAFKTLNDSRFQETASDSQGAEIFNFSPEIYLSPPIFKPTSTITSGNYDAIGILPPIL